MKSKVILVALTLLLFGVVQGCSDDDNDRGIRVGEEFTAAFNAQYPDVTNVKWERKGSYFVAEFRRAAMATRSEAWYNSEAKWQMTETDILFKNLPEAVKTAFAASKYATWRVDDVDMLERLGMEPIYVIEVESGKEEYDLYFSADGVLIKAVPDGDGNSEQYLSAALPEKVKEFIATRHPNAKIVDVEIEFAGSLRLLEVDIIDGKVARELIFNAENNGWLTTKTEVRKVDVPQNILDVLAASEYGSYKIDDIDHYESSSEQDYYIFELELGSVEIDVKITLDGELTLLK